MSEISERESAEELASEMLLACEYRRRCDLQAIMTPDGRRALMAIDAGNPIDTCYSLDRMMLGAAAIASGRAVRALAAAGADVNASLRSGERAVTVAALAGNWSALRSLIRLGGEHAPVVTKYVFERMYCVRYERLPDAAGDDECVAAEIERYTCAYCGATRKTRLCAGCRAVSYCDARCRDAHWAVDHRARCGSWHSAWEELEHCNARVEATSGETRAFFERQVRWLRGIVAREVAAERWKDFAMKEAAAAVAERELLAMLDAEALAGKRQKPRKKKK